MTTRPCTQCGHPLPEQAKFCGKCGALTATTGAMAPPAEPAGSGTLKATPVHDFKKTMLGFARAPEPPSSGIAPPSQPTPSPRPLGTTTLGMANPASSLGPPPAAPPYNASKTMLGVALPGIAPLRPGEGKSASPTSTLVQPRRLDLPRGVDGPVPHILPAPEPLAEIPAPPAPRIVRKGGVSLVTVASATAGLVVVAGAAIALFWHGAPPITALPRVTPEGNDVLYLTCDPQSCKDGTTAELGGARSTFVSGATDLPLAQPLHVGTNALALHVDRPGIGRDEVISLNVPIAYRVRADVTTMNDPHPSIVIHVEALPGSEVRIAEKPVTLDDKGTATYALDESAATEGPADESRAISVDVPYTVTAASHGAEAVRREETGTVSARASVAPLRVDAPGGRAVVDTDHVLVAGRAAKGATVTVDGAATAVGTDGTFEATLPLPTLGERSIEVRSATTALSARTVRVSVKRVAHLSDEARAFEQQPSIGYDAAMSNLAASTGKSIILDGDVIEPRASWHRTLLLMDDTRGCAKGPCLARVIVGQDLTVARGERLRAYGRIARAFAIPGGQSVPEVEADFVLPTKR
jgi:hypothetical protein